MLKAVETVKMHSYPGMVAIVGTSGDYPNFMAAGWHSYLSMNPPMYGVAIGRERFTYECLQKSKAFTINFLPASLEEFIQLSGHVSGREVNKLDISQLSYQQATTVDAPYLSGAYIVYECKVKQMIPTGDHDWVVGEITQCYVDQDSFNKDGLPNFSKLNIPLYLGRATYVKVDDMTEQRQYKSPYEK